MGASPPWFDKLATGVVGLARNCSLVLAWWVGSNRRRCRADPL